MASSTRETTRPILGATRARQGRFGRHVFWVLLFGTLLAALGLFAAWTWRSGDLASTNSNNGPSSAAEAFRAPEPAPIQSAVEGQVNDTPDHIAPAGKTPSGGGSSPTP
ncbi:hypothetical protein [Phenylobacterium sp.]|uniref:hypothetical protein n=1 Tax=Phenylobacterium sp. TaxID=1871053 RepID=UPI00391BA391